MTPEEMIAAINDVAVGIQDAADEREMEGIGDATADDLRREAQHLRAAVETYIERTSQ